MTPYEKLTGTKPDITNLRTFGCRVHAMKPGDRPAKLDHHTSNGIFVGYTATMKNIYYIDDKTGIVKIGVHAVFDEAHFIAPSSKTPLAAQTLQSLGYSAFRDEFKNGKFKNKHTLHLTLTHEDSVPPSRCNSASVLYDMFPSTPIQNILPGHSVTIDTNIIATIPEG